VEWRHGPPASSNSSFADRENIQAMTIALDSWPRKLLCSEIVWNT
jgi:hypothetical protein